MGVTAAEFYDESRIAIVPMGFCFPGLDAKGGDRRPRPECAPLWRGKVFAQLPELQLMLLVGAYAQKWHLPGCEDSLTQTVAAWRQILDRPRLPSMIPLPHPSWRNNGWLRNNPWFSCELLPELRRRVRNTLENE